MTELGNISGGEGWRLSGLSLVRLVKRNKVPEIQAVCVVSKARARRALKVFRVRALAVQEGRGLAAEAVKRLQEELGWAAGSEYKLASCIKKEGVGFYARQGWAGGDEVWE